ncbi:uncharacterized protein LOC129588006 [Paramacrobiotus metropolitanus]|uniref:uncharacterized protein LOC129588006 n=1 Tax=Paramacrobiotus metropolitanus TaxID=2943436 RepID=UPI0024456C86|nr:uncharacterized protein LOC129588006 [Paramacrobiotus metropolitanus]
MKEMPAEDLLNGLRHGVWEDEWSLRTTVGGRLTIEVADNFSNYGRLMAAVSAENIPNIIAILPPVRELEYFEYSNLNSFLEIETGVFHIEMDVVGVREDMELVFAVVQAGEYDGYFRFRFNFH